jgi:aminomethyltransferase
MVEFADYEMPLSYSAIEEEHHAVRTNAGYFDVSHMAEFIIEGDYAVEFVSFVFSNSVPEIHQAKYGVLMDDKGEPIDDAILYRLDTTQFLLISNAANEVYVEKHLIDNAFIYEFTDTVIRNISSEKGLIALQGPNAKPILESVLKTSLDMKRFHIQEIEYQNDTILVARTGYTGEDGFEIMASLPLTMFIWEDLYLTEAVPCGLGARDTLRFEAGYPLFGQDLLPVLSPLVSGLKPYIDLSKEFGLGLQRTRQYIKEGLQDMLVGVEILDKKIARNGYAIYDGQKRIGEITTGYKLKHFDQPKAMALVKMPYSNIGTEFDVSIRGTKVKGRVIPLPFYQKLKKKKVQS